MATYLHPPGAGKSGLNMFYVYILRSLRDGKKYVGLTNNLAKRIKQHNHGLCDATRNRTPLVLIHFESFLRRNEAAEREKFYKTGKGREYIKLVLKIK
jgi:putative endonuclease